MMWSRPLPKNNRKLEAPELFRLRRSEIVKRNERLTALWRQLRAWEQKYWSLIESANDAVILLQNGRIRYANRSAADLSGYSLSELYQLDGVLSLVSEADRERVRRHCKRFQRRGDVPTFEMGARRKDGDEVALEVRGSVIEHRGRPAVQYTIRDVTEQKFLRQQVMFSEKMAALGQLISGVAHELNNPLTVMIGYSELLTRKEGLTPDVQHGLEMIQEASERAKNIVRNVLAFARKHRPVREPVNINEVIERTVALRAYELGVSDIEAVQVLAPDLPEVTADAHQLQQVLLNLIINAEQAMSQAQGRGQLTIRTREKAPRQKNSALSEPKIEIVMTDNGPGIEPAHLNRIFEPFFTTKPAGQGTGLGLSITRGIIRNHGGCIDVRSEPGQGTTFIIELPVKEPLAAGTSQPPPSFPGRKGAPKRVFIVDDEPNIVDLLREIMTAEGHFVETAASGAEALARLRKKEYDLIFCDMRMPHMDGQELYRRIKRGQGSMAERIIFVTGDVISPQTQEFLTTSGSRFLEKPFIPQEVVRLVRSIPADEGRSHGGGVSLEIGAPSGR